MNVYENFDLIDDIALAVSDNNSSSAFANCNSISQKKKHKRLNRTFTAFQSGIYLIKCVAFEVFSYRQTKVRARSFAHPSTIARITGTRKSQGEFESTNKLINGFKCFRPQQVCFADDAQKAIMDTKLKSQQVLMA